MSAKKTTGKETQYLGEPTKEITEKISGNIGKTNLQTDICVCQLQTQCIIQCSQCFTQCIPCQCITPSQCIPSQCIQCVSPVQCISPQCGQCICFSPPGTCFAQCIQCSDCQTCIIRPGDRQEFSKLIDDMKDLKVRFGDLEKVIISLTKNK
jgi:hypothetical protein